MFTQWFFQPSQSGEILLVDFETKEASVAGLPNNGPVYFPFDGTYGIGSLQIPQTETTAVLSGPFGVVSINTQGSFGLKCMTTGDAGAIVVFTTIQKYSSILVDMAYAATSGGVFDNVTLAIVVSDVSNIATAVNPFAQSNIGGANIYTDISVNLSAITSTFLVSNPGLERIIVQFSFSGISGNYTFGIDNYRGVVS